jgi:colanic acid biosynthesis glycosyl transferase WcaI
MIYNLLGAGYVLFAVKSDAALMTNPALEVWLIALVVRLKRIPFHYRLHDLYPEIAIRLGFIGRTSLLARAIERIEHYCLRCAGTVSVVTASFQSFLSAQGVSPDKLSVIPDWVDTVHICDLPKRNDFSLRHNLADKFVVGYGGNIGRSQGLDLLVEAAVLLREESGIIFLIIGEGAKKRELMSLCRRQQLENVIFMPFQPEETLQQVYASWDVGFVSLIPGLSPEWQTGKVFSIMASSRAVLAAVDLGGEVHRLVEKTNCGVCVQSGNATKLAQAIGEMFANRDRLASLGANGRRAVEQAYSRTVCTKRLESLVACLVPESRS